MIAGQTYSYTPYWGVYPAGDSSGNGNPKVGAQVVQIGPASGSWSSGISGALNFNPGPADSVQPRQIITTMDGSPQQTFATPGYVRTGNAADSFIGTDTAGIVGTQDQTYGAPGGHNFYVNDTGTNSTHAKLNIGASSATFNVPLTVNGNLSVTSGSVTLPITGASSQCLHVSSTGVVTGTGLDCGSGGGSGTVNSGTASQVAMYSASGSSVSGDSSLTDSGSVLNYAGIGGISAAAGTFSGNLTVNGQLQVAGPWLVNSPIPGTAMTAAGTGTSSLGISNDGNFYISANGGSLQKVATSATSSYFSNFVQEDANTLGAYNGTTAQALHIYGTYTNSSNYERTGLGWDGADNYFVLRNENAGTGGQHGIGFWIGSGIRWAIDTASAFKPFSNNSFDIDVLSPSQLVPRTVYAGTSFDTLTQGRQNFQLCNDATTGTLLNFLAAYNAATPSCAVKAAITNTDGVIGVVSSGSGTSGNAVITYRGYVQCSFDGSTVAGDYVVASTTNAGDCHDAGGTRPTGVQIIGRVETTNATGGTYGIRATMESPTGGASGLTDPGSNGFVVRTGVNTTATRSFAAGSTNITITNPTGAAGNPTIDVSEPTLFDSPALTGTPTAPTAAANTSTTQIATTAYVGGQMAPNTTAVPWMPTPHYSTGITFSTAANKAVFTGVILTFPKTTTKVTYLTSTADNTANVYDIGIYSGTSGGTCTQVTHVGPTAGTTFSPTASAWKTLNWTGGSVTLQPGRYYMAYSTSCSSSCATIGGDSAGMTFAGSSGGANSNVSVTSGGTLPATVTCPSDSFTTSSMPTWAIN